MGVDVAFKLDLSAQVFYIRSEFLWNTNFVDVKNMGEQIKVETRRHLLCIKERKIYRQALSKNSGQTVCRIIHYVISLIW